MDSPSPPQAPDPTATANAQTASNVQTARTQSKLSNPNVVTPYGHQTVTWGTGTPQFNQAGFDAANSKYQTDLSKFNDGYGDSWVDEMGTRRGFAAGGTAPTAPTREQFTSGVEPDQATVTQTLSPNQQRLLDSQEGLSLQMADIGKKGLNAVGEQLATPMDSASGQAAAGKAYAAMAARLDPQWQQNTAAEETKLRNQGVVPGGEAYDNEMRTFNQGKNDAYSQAQTAAQAMAPQFQGMDIAGRNALLNQLNAIRTGSQVSSPQFQPYQGSNVAPTNTLAAQQMAYQGGLNNYNAGVGGANSFNSGLMSMGAAALPLMFS